MTGVQIVFEGTIIRTAHVMTSVTEVVFFGVLFSEKDEWIRVATADITLAERIAFLQPEEHVRLRVQGKIVQGSSNYHQLVSVSMA
ncbi:hypothetical protein [Pectobacterium brasiliense]|uniref:hypothetical protein n=1 Tax=Pectobacterium brasiliense TaxID=180957 RepID=UPI001968F954|nr:hypothetical protein [Pectobacterium brasiliense]MBN3262924.1 hypothetical protein [Pectobacterium brasiliense]